MTLESVIYGVTHVERFYSLFNRDELHFFVGRCAFVSLHIWNFTFGSTIRPYLILDWPTFGI